MSWATSLRVSAISFCSFCHSGGQLTVRPAVVEGVGREGAGHPICAEAGGVRGEAAGHSLGAEAGVRVVVQGAVGPVEWVAVPKALVVVL